MHLSGTLTCLPTSLVAVQLYRPDPVAAHVLRTAVCGLSIEMQREINCVRYGTKRFRDTKRGLRRNRTTNCVQSAPDRGPVESFDVYHLFKQHGKFKMFRFYMIKVRAKITVRIEHPNKYRTPVRGEVTFQRDVSGKTYLMIFTKSLSDTCPGSQRWY